MVGTADGLVLLCSTTSQTASIGTNQWIDPVISELQPHQFAVRSLHLRHIKNRQDMVLISSDVSGEILIRTLNEVNIF